MGEGTYMVERHGEGCRHGWKVQTWVESIDTGEVQTWGKDMDIRSRYKLVARSGNSEQTKFSICISIACSTA